MSKKIMQPMSIGDSSERIRRDFVELVPEEDWKEMVKEQLAHFTNPTSYYYGDKRTSPLVELIRRELEAMFVVKIKAALSRPEFCENDKEPCDFLKAFIADNLSEITKVVFEQASRGLMQSIWNGLPQKEF